MRISQRQYSKIERFENIQHTHSQLLIGVSQPLPEYGSARPLFNRIRTKATDSDGHRRLAHYTIRWPVAINRISFDRKSGMVIYRSKLHGTPKPDYQLVPASKWLRLLMNHMPDK